MGLRRGHTAFILLLRALVLPASARGILADRICLFRLEIQRCLVQGDRVVGEEVGGGDGERDNPLI